MKREEPELPLFGNNSGGDNGIDNSYTSDDDIEFDEIYGDEPKFLGQDDEDDDDGMIPSSCGMFDLFTEALDNQKPFGVDFTQENMENFLRERGYKIIKRYSDTTKKENSIAIKPGSSYIPEDDFSNIEDTFNEEVRNILLKWLLKIGKED